MQQQDRPFAAGAVIGLQHCAQLVQQRVCGRKRIRCRTRGAGGRALAAPGANLCADLDVIAIGHDRAGRAEIEAAVAAREFRARMRAQFGGEIDVLRLVEAADEVAGLQHRAQHCGGVLGIRPQIAVAQIMAALCRAEVSATKGIAAGYFESIDPVLGRY